MNWSDYNKSQTMEKIIFVKLLRELCNTIPRRKKFGGRKSLELRHMILCLCLKTYCIKSGRRIIGELEIFKQINMIHKIPHFNSLFNYLRNPNITETLQDLIKFSALPLKQLERHFCCDSTGFATGVTQNRWSTIRQKYSRHHQYMKAHISFGALTNIITHCIVTKGNEADCPKLEELFNETSKNFNIREYSADKAYLSRKNVELIFNGGAIPLIPFKKDTSGKARGSMIWKEMFEFFKYNNELFMKLYHQRSNAESGMQMIKARFGHLTLMRDEVGMKNDVLVKILCHNICVLCQELLLMGIKIDFAQLRKKFAQD